MSAPQLLLTSLLLGLMVLCGGAYALLFTAGALRRSRALTASARACYALEIATAAALTVATPLGPGWKVLIAASAIATWPVPPLTMRWLDAIHRTSERQS